MLSKNPINLHDKSVVLRLSSQEIEESMYADIRRPDNRFPSLICINLSLSLGNIHFEPIQFPIMTYISYQAILRPQIYLD